MSHFDFKTALCIANDLMPSIIGGSDPKTTILKHASVNNMSPGQVRVLGTAYNTVRSAIHFKTASNRAAEFPVLNAEELQAEYSATLPDHLKAAAEVPKDEDIPQPTEIPESQKKDRLLRLYRRKHGYDDDTGEDLGWNSEKKRPTFEEWKDSIPGTKAASLIHGGIHTDTITDADLGVNPWLLPAAWYPKQAAVEAPPAPTKDLKDEIVELEKEAMFAWTEAKLHVDRAFDQVRRKCANARRDIFSHAETTLIGRHGDAGKATSDYAAERLNTHSRLQVKRASRGIDRLTDESDGLTAPLLALHEALTNAHEARDLLKQAQDLKHAEIKAELERNPKLAKTMAELLKEAARSKPAPPPPQTGTSQGTQSNQGSASPNPNPPVKRPGKEPSSTGEDDPKVKLAPSQADVSDRVPPQGDSGLTKALGGYNGILDGVVGTGSLQKLMGALSVGANPGQRHVDKQQERLQTMDVLRSIMTEDQVVSHHAQQDPERVARMASDLINLVPELSRNRGVLTFALREGLSHDSLPISTVTALLSGEKAKTDTEKNRRAFAADDYGSGGKSLGDLLPITG